jgi:hypothetical protein
MKLNILVLITFPVVFWYVFVILSCDVSICKTASPVFYFLVDSATSGILNYIHRITWKWQRYPDATFICRSRVLLHCDTLSSFRSRVLLHCDTLSSFRSRVLLHCDTLSSFRSRVLLHCDTLSSFRPNQSLL